MRLTGIIDQQKKNCRLTPQIIIENSYFLLLPESSPFFTRQVKSGRLK
jgi:hypothetical protein